MCVCCKVARGVFNLKFIRCVSIPMMECGFGTERTVWCVLVFVRCSVPFPLCLVSRVFFHPVHVYCLCIMHVQCECLKFVYFINFSKFLFPVRGSCRGSCFGLRALSALLFYDVYLCV